MTSPAAAIRPEDPAFVVPDVFAANRAARSGDAGRTWVATLPNVVTASLLRWQLRRDPGDPRVRFGDLAITVPVLTRSGARAILKVGWQDESSRAEGLALTAWAGRGAAALLASDPGTGVLLLERLDASRTLRDLPLQQAAEVAGDLLRRLAVAPPPGMRTSAEIAEGIAGSLAGRNAGLGHRIPGRVLDAATAASQAVCPAGQSVLVHADLHYGNVLAGVREPWLAIDPKPVSGDPELAVAELLWTRCAEFERPGDTLRLLATISDAGRLDPGRARAWALARVVDYWLWGLTNGLPIDPPRCARLAEVLVHG